MQNTPETLDVAQVLSSIAKHQEFEESHLKEVFANHAKASSPLERYSALCNAFVSSSLLNPFSDLYLTNRLGKNLISLVKKSQAEMKSMHPGFYSLKPTFNLLAQYERLDHDNPADSIDSILSDTLGHLNSEILLEQICSARASVIVSNCVEATCLNTTHYFDANILYYKNVRLFDISTFVTSQALWCDELSLDDTSFLSRLSGTPIKMLNPNKVLLNLFNCAKFASTFHDRFDEETATSYKHSLHKFIKLFIREQVVQAQEEEFCKFVESCFQKHCETGYIITPTQINPEFINRSDYNPLIQQANQYAR